MTFVECNNNDTERVEAIVNFWRNIGTPAMEYFVSMDELMLDIVENTRAELLTGLSRILWVIEIYNV